MNQFSSYLSDPEIQSLIGERFRQWRIHQGFTQIELTERAGVSRGAIQRLETGQGVDLRTLVALIRSLDLVDQLNNFLPEPEPTIQSLKELKEAVPTRRRVRKKHG